MRCNSEREFAQSHATESINRPESQEEMLQRYLRAAATKREPLAITKLLLTMCLADI